MAKINLITSAEQKSLDASVSPYTYTIESSNSRTTTLVIKVPRNTRGEVKKNVEAKLKKNRVPFEAKIGGSHGSIGATGIIFKEHFVNIKYKPSSGAGGMAETTLNSTITELCPAIAFTAGVNFKDVDAFYDFVATRGRGYTSVYVNRDDLKSGDQFITEMYTSSKFKEKMENAIAITNYLYDLHANSPIVSVIWGYRAKPQGISGTHKGDLFVKFKNGKWLGVSLKAGGEKTKEPQLNTYVNKIFDVYGREADKQKLINEVQTKVHDKFGLEPDWQSRNKKVDSILMIEAYRKAHPAEYERRYDTMLEIVRDAIIATVNKNMQETLKFIQQQIIGSDENVPLVVIKAYGTNWKEVKDENKLAVFLNKATKIQARKSTSSKQNWEIVLSNAKEKVIMNMSIRTNKSQPENKVAQGFNLAVKFNGLS